MFIEMDLHVIMARTAKRKKRQALELLKISKIAD